MERSYKKREEESLMKGTLIHIKTDCVLTRLGLDGSFVQLSDCEAMHTRCEPSQHASIIKVYCNSTSLQFS